MPAGDFHNPYNFVPTPPRDTTHLIFGDHNPIEKGMGHGRYERDRWSGRIQVTLTTVTPLLIPDIVENPEADHKTFDIRLDGQGKPYLPPTTVKGMLRSAYEIVTNSRYAVFEKHGDRLAYRMEAKGSPIPARVEKQGDRLVLRLMESGILGGAGKLLRYQNGKTLSIDKGEAEFATSYETSDTLPQHGDAVWVTFGEEGDNQKKGIIAAIRPRILGNDNPPDRRREWRSGWVCVTGANIKNKQYERVFLDDEDDRAPIPVTVEMQHQWRELITNYQEIHTKDLEKREKESEVQRRSPQAYLGDEPGQTAWSRHVYVSEAKELQEGSLCYVVLQGDRTPILIPVAISRRLYEAAPQNLLHKSLQPAVKMSELSPADRVFGWVNQTGKGAYKGNLRIGTVQCVSDQPLKRFAAGLPLAILGQPKPEQARFYVAQDQSGTPLKQRLEKQDGYLDQQQQGLRGRKVYPHHQGLPAGYWQNATEDRTQHQQAGYYQEYRKPKGEKEQTDQNRSIKAWVKPGVAFRFSIEITNLADAELGALLWLLSLPSEMVHRLGGGKPLGFGSVQLAIDWQETYLCLGETWQNYYASLLDTGLPNQAELAQQSIETYQQEFANFCQQPIFEQIPLIQAFLQSAKGFRDGKPIHYPRVKQSIEQTHVPPTPEGEGFQWFVANEQIEDSQIKVGCGLSLPALWQEEGGGLPLHLKPPEKQKDGKKTIGKKPIGKPKKRQDTR